MHDNSLRLRLLFDRSFKVIIILLALLSICPLFLVFAYIIQKGAGSLSLGFLVSLPKPVGEVGGGIVNAIAGSIIMVGMASIIAVPISLLAGIYLSEYPERKSSYWIRLCAEMLQGVPSIIIGILGYTWIVRLTGFSGISGAVALSMMMIPVITRSTEESLKLVPNSLREAALAMGTPYQRVVFRVVSPSAFSGILSGVILSVARVAGETAPLIFTAFGSNFLVLDPRQPMSSLPQLIYNYATSGYDDWINIAWGASFVLIMIVLSLNIFVKWVNRRWKTEY